MYLSPDLLTGYKILSYDLGIHIYIRGSYRSDCIGFVPATLNNDLLAFIGPIHLFDLPAAEFPAAYY